MAYTDYQKQCISMEEYINYDIGSAVKIDYGTIIGYVSEVINNCETGEQAYVIIDSFYGYSLGSACNQ